LSHVLCMRVFFTRTRPPVDDERIHPAPLLTRLYETPPVLLMPWRASLFCVPSCQGTTTTPIQSHQNRSKKARLALRTRFCTPDGLTKSRCCIACSRLSYRTSPSTLPARNVVIQVLRGDQVAFALWRATIRPARRAAILLQHLLKTLSSSTPFSNLTVAVMSSTRSNNNTVDERGLGQLVGAQERAGQTAGYVQED